MIEFENTGLATREDVASVTQEEDLGGGKFTWRVTFKNGKYMIISQEDAEKLADLLID